MPFQPKPTLIVLDTLPMILGEKFSVNEKQFIKELLQRYAVFLAVILAVLIIINYWKFSKYLLAFSMLNLVIHLVVYKKYKNYYCVIYKIYTLIKYLKNGEVYI